MHKFYIKSLGCKTNQTEGQIISELLVNKGFIKTNNKSEADIFIINSCSVTEHADNQTFYLIKQMKKENPKIKVVLTGCTAQTADINKIDADLILGNSEKLRIDEYINSLFEYKKSIFIQNIFEIKKYETKILHKTNKTRPSVKIQDGCDNRCSYCVIPFARGNSRSETIENIIEQINIHTKNNVKEIILTGIHIGQWGADLWGKKLVDLLYEIENTDIVRYRLGSLYVNEIDEELFDFLVHSKKFCPHFHLSLQSLCDKTLKNMNRKYTKHNALEMIEKIHKNFNTPFIGADIILGFPDENRDDFLETKEAILNSNLSYVHSFPYSKRKGTSAYGFLNQVLDHVKKERTKEIIEISNSLHKKFLEKNKNQIRPVLFEKRGKDGLFSGISDNYVKIYRKSDENIRNTIELVDFSKEELY